MKDTIINLTLLGFTLLIVFLIGEGMCRLFLDPANYLDLSLQEDEKLGHRIPEDAQGYDDWGFKNDEVPDKADIVTIGDSQTFGINATLENNWPGHLQSLSQKKVYNLSVGGYGPVQYYHLFKTKALQLDPDHIIIGYYVGNDPVDSYDMVYRSNAWPNLRNPDFSEKLDTATTDTLDYYLGSNIFSKSSDQFLAGLRGWLAGNSILYRLVFHSPIVSGLKRQIETALGMGPKTVKNVDLNVPEKQIKEGFRPVHRSFKMDITNFKVQEGLRITLDLFKQMKQISDRRGIKFTVLLIPTKEIVYQDYLYDNENLRFTKEINNLLDHEHVIREKSINYFKEHDLAFIDALPSMQQAADSLKIYPPTYNDHPNPRGYELMAKSYFNSLQGYDLSKNR